MSLLPKADSLAHVLYAPTMLGRRSVRARWHHRIHLIPGALLRWVCNRYEDRLLIGSDIEPATVVVPVGWTCAHTTVTFSPNVRMPRPTSWCGCTMLPILR